MSWEPTWTWRRWNAFVNTRIVLFSYRGTKSKTWLNDRYTFIKEIRRVCENGDFEGVSTKIVPKLEKIAHDPDYNILTALLGQFEYIAKVHVFQKYEFQLYFDQAYEKGLELVSTVIFPILDRILVEIHEVRPFSASDAQVQASAINAFVKSCGFIKRGDQGVYTYLYIVKVRTLQKANSPHDQYACSLDRERRILACKLFHDAACILGSEVLSQFGVSELLLLAEDNDIRVRKYAILALGPVSCQLDSIIVEDGIYNCLLKNTGSSSWIIRRACAIVIPQVFSNVQSHKYFLEISRIVGELFRDTYVITEKKRRWFYDDNEQQMG